MVCRIPTVFYLHIMIIWISLNRTRSDVFVLKVTWKCFGVPILCQTMIEGFYCLLYTTHQKKTLPEPHHYKGREVDPNRGRGRQMKGNESGGDAEGGAGGSDCSDTFFQRTTNGIVSVKCSERIH